MDFQKSTLSCVTIACFSKESFCCMYCDFSQYIQPKSSFSKTRASFESKVVFFKNTRILRIACCGGESLNASKKASQVNLHPSIHPRICKEAPARKLPELTRIASVHSPVIDSVEAGKKASREFTRILRSIDSPASFDSPANHSVKAGKKASRVFAEDSRCMHACMQPTGKKASRVFGATSSKKASRVFGATSSKKASRVNKQQESFPGQQAARKLPESWAQIKKRGGDGTERRRVPSPPLLSVVQAASVVGAEDLSS
jgi:hypothetical protein